MEKRVGLYLKVTGGVLKQEKSKQKTEKNEKEKEQEVRNKSKL